MATATATTTQTAAPAMAGSIDPAALVVTIPVAQDVTILMRGNSALVDLREVLNEPITFSRIDGDLQMVFENGGTVVIEGFFDGSGAAAAVLVGDEGTTTLSLDQFSSIAGVAGTEGTQTAAGAPVTLGDQVNQPDGSGQSFEDPGLTGLGDGLGILDLLGPGDLPTDELLLPEDLLPGLENETEENPLSISSDDTFENPESSPSENLYLWIDQPNHNGWSSSYYLDIHEFEALTVSINGVPAEFSLEENLTNGVNETPAADEGEYALDGEVARELFLNLGEVDNLPDSGEIRIDFNYASFDKLIRRPEDDSAGGAENSELDPDQAAEGYRFGMQIGDDGTSSRTVIDHTDNGIHFSNDETESAKDWNDSPRTIKFEYEIDETGEIVLTNILTIFRGGLIIDVDQDNEIQMDRSISFDMDGDGVTEEVGWMGAGDGLLVMDLNRDGKITDVGEVVGQNFAWTPEGNGGSSEAKYFSGAYEALFLMDANALRDRNEDGYNDGVVDEKDAFFHDLRIWIDENGNGLTDDGELKTLLDLGITSISYDSLREDQSGKDQTGWDDVNDNIIDRQGTIIRNGVEENSIYDVRFWESEPEPGSTDTVTTGASDVLSSLADADLFSDILQTSSRDMGDILGNAFPTPVTDPATDQIDAKSQAGLPDTRTGAEMPLDMQSMGETINTVLDTPVADAVPAGQAA